MIRYQRTQTHISTSRMRFLAFEVDRHLVVSARLAPPPCVHIHSLGTWIGLIICHGCTQCRTTRCSHNLQRVIQTLSFSTCIAFRCQSIKFHVTWRVLFHLATDPSSLSCSVTQKSKSSRAQCGVFLCVCTISSPCTNVMA